MILVVPRVNPDLDGVASALAYAELLSETGRVANWTLEGSPQAEPDILLRRFRVSVPRVLRADAFILVDMSSLAGLPSFVDPAKVVEVVDHRVAPRVREDFPNAKVQIEKVGAAATLIAEKFRERGVEPSPRAAAFLYCAILSNTLNLSTANTTARDLRIVGYLERLVPEGIGEWLLREKTERYLEDLRGQITKDFKWYSTATGKMGMGQLEVYGAHRFLERTEEILGILRELEVRHGLAGSFLNMPDIREKVTYLISGSEEVKRELEEKLGVEFHGHVAKMDRPVLRKELLPLLGWIS